MITKTVIANKGFIQAIKAEIAAKKERHKKHFSGIKPAVVQTLQKMGKVGQ